MKRNGGIFLNILYFFLILVVCAGGIGAFFLTKSAFDDYFDKKIVNESNESKVFNLGEGTALVHEFIKKNVFEGIVFETPIPEIKINGTTIASVPFILSNLFPEKYSLTADRFDVIPGYRMESVSKTDIQNVPNNLQNKEKDVVSIIFEGVEVAIPQLPDVIAGHVYYSEKNGAFPLVVSYSWLEQSPVENNGTSKKEWSEFIDKMKLRSYMGRRSPIDGSYYASFYSPGGRIKMETQFSEQGVPMGFQVTYIHPMHDVIVANMNNFIKKGLKTSNSVTIGPWVFGTPTSIPLRRIAGVARDGLVSVYSLNGSIQGEIFPLEENIEIWNEMQIISGVSVILDSSEWEKHRQNILNKWFSYKQWREGDPIGKIALNDNLFFEIKKNKIDDNNSIVHIIIEDIRVTEIKNAFVSSMRFFDPFETRKIYVETLIDSLKK